MGVLLVALLASVSAALLALLVTKVSAALQAQRTAEGDVRTKVQSWHGIRHSKRSSPPTPTEAKASARQSPPISPVVHNRPSASASGREEDALSRQGSFHLSDAVHKYRRDLMLDLGWGTADTAPLLPQTRQDTRQPLTSPSAGSGLVTSAWERGGAGGRGSAGGGDGAVTAWGAYLGTISGYVSSLKESVAEAVGWEEEGLPTTSEESAALSASEDKACASAVAPRPAAAEPSGEGSSAYSIASLWHVVTPAGTLEAQDTEAGASGRGYTQGSPVSGMAGSSVSRGVDGFFTPQRLRSFVSFV